MDTKITITQPASNIVRVTGAANVTQPTPNVVRIYQTNHIVTITENHLSLSVGATTTGTGGATTLGTDLTVTNTIGDAIAGVTTYTAGTPFEVIINDILAPFFEPEYASIVPTSNNVSYYVEGSNIVFPTGVIGTVQSWQIEFNHKQNLDNASGWSIVSNEQTNGSDTTLAYLSGISWETYANPHSHTYNYTPVGLNINGQFYTITFTAGYLSEDGEGPAVPLVATARVVYRDPMIVLTNTSAGFASVSELIAGGTVVRNLLSLDPNSATQTVSFECSEETVNSSNFTYLLVPTVFNVTEIAASTSGVGIADYTSSFQVFDNGGLGYIHSVGDANRSYKVYRSNQPGAFDSDIDLTMTLTV